MGEREKNFPLIAPIGETTGKNRQEKLGNPFFNRQHAARIWFIVSTISIALIFGVEKKEKKKKEAFLPRHFSTLHPIVGIGKRVSRSFSITYLAPREHLRVSSWGFEELIYGLVWGNNMIFLLVLFHAFFTRDIFMADWEGFFSFGDYFFFLLFFPFYDTWTVNVIKRNRKIKAFHLVEKRKRNLFEIIHSYNLFYVRY